MINPGAVNSKHHVNCSVISVSYIQEILNFISKGCKCFNDVLRKEGFKWKKKFTLVKSKKNTIMHEILS